MLHKEILIFRVRLHPMNLASPGICTAEQIFAPKIIHRIASTDVP
jgi:hypothetical protein